MPSATCCSLSPAFAAMAVTRSWPITCTTCEPEIAGLGPVPIQPETTPPSPFCSKVCARPPTPPDSSTSLPTSS